MKERARELREPLVDRCPLCGVSLVPGYRDAVCCRQAGNVVPTSANRGFVDASEPHAFEKGYITTKRLTWKCRRCGFQWEHGEFEEKDEG